MTIELDYGAIARAIVEEMAKQPIDRPRYLKPSTVADELGCTPEHVYALISAGHLEAIDVSEDTTKRKSLRVTEASLRVFTTIRHQ